MRLHGCDGLVERIVHLGRRDPPNCTRRRDAARNDDGLLQSRWLLARTVNSGDTFTERAGRALRLARQSHSDARGPLSSMRRRRNAAVARLHRRALL
jgi:hypothetical protein